MLRQSTPGLISFPKNSFQVSIWNLWLKEYQLAGGLSGETAGFGSVEVVVVVVDVVIVGDGFGGLTGFGTGTFVTMVVIVFSTLAVVFFMSGCFVWLDLSSLKRSIVEG